MTTQPEVDGLRMDDGKAAKDAGRLLSGLAQIGHGDSVIPADAKRLVMGYLRSYYEAGYACAVEHARVQTDCNRLALQKLIGEVGDLGRALELQAGQCFDIVDRVNTRVKRSGGSDAAAADVDEVASLRTRLSAFEQREVLVQDLLKECDWINGSLDMSATGRIILRAVKAVRNFPINPEGQAHE